LNSFQNEISRFIFHAKVKNSKGCYYGITSKTVTKTLGIIFVQLTTYITLGLKLTEKAEQFTMTNHYYLGDPAG